MTCTTRSRYLRTFFVSIAAAGLLAGCDFSAGDGQGGDDHRQVSEPDASGIDSGRDAADTTDTSGDTSGDDAGQGDADAGGPSGPAYALSAEPYTTLQALWAPRPLSQDTISAIVTREIRITDIDRYDDYDIGVELEPGQPWVEHDDLAPGFQQGAGAGRKSLLYFWETADPQMIDEESPIRFAGTTLAPIGSTYRPQSHLIAQAYEAQVRSARRISDMSGRPFDFAFIAGDMTDGGQENELDWTTHILTGGRIDPDSGVDDDPVPGPGNDFADPFESIGIGVPWYPAIGNHETLYSGLFPASEALKAAAVGDEVIDFTSSLPLFGGIEGASNGFRDASTPNADVVTEGHTPADPRRRILDLGEVLSALHDAPGEPAGHGIDSNNLFEELGYYSFHPLAGKPVRFIVLNTLHPTLSTASGGMSRAQFEWLEDELDDAERAGELVIVGSHHKSADLGPSSIVGSGELRALLSSYDNVILHVAGHGHHNSKELIRPGGNHQPEQGYWEIMCASTVDFPMQSRIIELVYEGGGYLSVYVTNLEQNAARDTMGHRALDLAAGRKYFIRGAGYRDGWEDSLDTVNLLLRFKLPAKVVESIEASDWPTRVESEETLSTLSGP